MVRLIARQLAILGKWTGLDELDGSTNREWPLELLCGVFEVCFQPEHVSFLGWDGLWTALLFCAAVISAVCSALQLVVAVVLL